MAPEHIDLLREIADAIETDVRLGPKNGEMAEYARNAAAIRRVLEDRERLIKFVGMIRLDMPRRWFGRQAKKLLAAAEAVDGWEKFDAERAARFPGKAESDG
jgi:hypothetical protein